MTVFKNKVLESPTYLSHPAWLRLEDQTKYYDSGSSSFKKIYTHFKFIQIILILLIILVSHIDPIYGLYAKWINSISGAVIASLETIGHMNQYFSKWESYRAIAKLLKHERYFFLSKAGHFKNMSDSDRLICLSERVEGHISPRYAPVSSNSFNRPQNVKMKEK